jgi:transcriptional regulator with XRE-family HTH domain
MRRGGAIMTTVKRTSAKPVEACHAAVGVRIRAIREALGLTQDDIAKRVGLVRASVANIEIGRQRLLLDNVEDFARALGTTPKNLLKGVWW